MSWEDCVRKVEPYVAGEQPKNPDIIKLNTNECPYPPAPGVRAALNNLNIDILRKYPDPDVLDIRKLLAKRFSVDVDQVFVGVGSDDVLAMSFLMVVCCFWSERIYLLVCAARGCCPTPPAHRASIRTRATKPGMDGMCGRCVEGMVSEF